MNAEEKEIYDFLKQTPESYVSVVKISKSVGQRRNFLRDRVWARPLLRRMEMDGLLESNNGGDYRLKNCSGDTTTFMRALARPDIPLGDTTIISLDDIKSEDEEAA